jgi:SAM-dependent methyltransferase
MDTEQYANTAEFYDFVVPYRTREDVAFFVEAAQASGGPVLEVGCGTGRVLIPTARAGIAITGIDLSPHMLDLCQRKLAREAADVHACAQLELADMRDFELGQTFKLITIPFRPFQHLIEVEDQIGCLRCIHRHLADEGRFILDVFNPSLRAIASEVTGEEDGHEPEFTLPDGRRVLRRNRVVARDVCRQVQDIELIYHVTHPDGRTERIVHAFPMRYFFRYEVEHLLARCGFELEELYADYDRSPYGSKYPGELIFLAKKVAGVSQC